MPHYPRKWSLKSRQLLVRSNEMGRYLGPEIIATGL